MAIVRTGYANLAAFPLTGAVNIIYVDLSNGNEYTWNGSSYVVYTPTEVIVSLGYKDAAWFTANPTFLLGKGQIIHLEQTSTYKLGDGTTTLAALNFLGGGSGVQSVTGPQVDDTDPNNPIVNPLGLIKIVDLNGDFFTDLASANTYVSSFTSATITNESFDNGIYYFTVPTGSDFSNSDYFLGDAFAKSAYIIDELGLISTYGSDLYNNNSNENMSVFGGTMTCGVNAFTSSSCDVFIYKIITDYSSFQNTSGRFKITTPPLLTGATPTDFFLGSSATILTFANNFGNANLVQAASNGANVQYDGINLATLNDVALKLPIEATQTTGVALTFLTDTIYGSVTTPETGNITFSLTGAKLGVTNLIYHNNGTEPTYSTMKKLSGSCDYVTGSINMIFVIYSDTTEVCYSINQRT